MAIRKEVITVLPSAARTATPSSVTLDIPNRGKSSPNMKGITKKKDDSD